MQSRTLHVPSGSALFLRLARCGLWLPSHTRWLEPLHVRAVDKNSTDNARNVQCSCPRDGLSGAGSSRPSFRAGVSRPNRQPYPALLCRRSWRHVQTPRSGRGIGCLVDLSLLILWRSLFALSIACLPSSLASSRNHTGKPLSAGEQIFRRGSAKGRRSDNFFVSAEGQLPLSCSPVARVEIKQSADLELRMGDRVED